MRIEPKENPSKCKGTRLLINLTQVETQKTSGLPRLKANDLPNESEFPNASKQCCLIACRAPWTGLKSPPLAPDQPSGNFHVGRCGHSASPWWLEVVLL